MDDYDVIIIGGGAAGLSAALVLSRARRRVLVVDSGTPRNAPASHMHGFLSRDGLPPAELLAVGRSEVEHYGGTVLLGAVEHVRSEETDGRPGFDVTLADSSVHHARRLLVATGLRDELPDVPGLRERWARDVLHCPYCHGYEVADRRLGVLWNGPATVGYAQIVRQWSHDVVLIAPPGALSDDARTALVARAVGIIEAAPTGLAVDDHDRLTGVLLDGAPLLHRDAVFVPPRFVPRSDLLAQLGCEVDDEGWTVTGANGTTSVAGVWAAGNVVNPRAQVITAAGEGSAAAIAINADLVADDVALAVRDFTA